MSSALQRVLHDGVVVGVTEYHNTSDTWCRTIWPNSPAYYAGRLKSAPPLSCWCLQDPVWVAIGDGGICTVKACLWCRVLILPGHDGYDYEEYSDSDDPAQKIEQERQMSLAKSAEGKP